MIMRGVRPAAFKSRLRYCTAAAFSSYYVSTCLRDLRNITWHVQGLSNFFSMQSPSGAVVIRRVLHVPHAFLRPIQLDHKLDFVVRKVGRRHCCRSKIVVTSPLGQANAAVRRPPRESITEPRLSTGSSPVRKCNIIRSHFRFSF